MKPPPRTVKEKVHDYLSSNFQKLDILHLFQLKEAVVATPLFLFTSGNTIN